MNAQYLVISALRSLNRHKMRSLLTTLGIIIGVVAIIAVMSIGEGAKYKVNKAIETLGSNFIIAIAATPKNFSQQRGAMNYTLKPADLKSVREECPDVGKASPGIMYTAKIVYDGANWSTTVLGASEEYLEIRQWSLLAGEYFTQQDVRTGAKVAVLGKKVADELFASANPIGSIIRIKKIPFRVIGVLSEKGKMPDGRDQDDLIQAPITTVQHKLMGKQNYSALIMSAVEASRMNTAAQQVRTVLRQNHRLREEEEDDFTLFTQDDISKASDAAGGVLNLLLLIIASISLIVGGIGIMNIMLVTVTERTKEIGIRMALGATAAKIRNQFLLEAVTICLAGGLVGMVLGIATAQAVGLTLGWPIFVSRLSVAISLSSSLLIGIAFGYYPAYKASSLNPIDALVDQ